MFRSSGLYSYCSLEDGSEEIRSQVRKLAIREVDKRSRRARRAASSVLAICTAMSWDASEVVLACPESPCQLIPASSDNLYYVKLHARAKTRFHRPCRNEDTAISVSSRPPLNRCVHLAG